MNLLMLLPKTLFFLELYLPGILNGHKFKFALALLNAKRILPPIRELR